MQHQVPFPAPAKLPPDQLDRIKRIRDGDPTVRPTQEDIALLRQYMLPQEKTRLTKLLKVMPIRRPEMTFRGNNLEIQKYVDAPRPAEFLLEGPAECLGGETRIYDPIANESIPIAELYARKKAPMVLTLNGVIQAEIPFVKGTDKLYRVKLANGDYFVCTMGHQVYAHQLVGDYPGEWRLVRDLRVGDLLVPPGIYTPTKVVDILYERVDQYYDLTVPIYHNYLAEGVWHHNTGKTYACLNLLDNLMRKYKKARGAMIRQFHVDMRSTVLEIFKREFVNTVNDIVTFGGEDVEFFHYKYTGSRIWVAGMDRPGSVLSGGLDVVYINEVRELKQESYEILTTRTTGRNGAIVPGMVFGDMNPAPYTHWMYAREAAGKLKILPGSHKDNPKLWDDVNNCWTPQGEEALTRLSNLTGALRAQLYEGKRVGATGLVYMDAWNENDGSVTELADYEKDAGEVMFATDDGYSKGSAPQTSGRDPQTGFYVADAHPRVILFVQIKPDGHLDVFDEIYACGERMDNHIAEAFKKPYPRPVMASYGPGASEWRGALQNAEIIPNLCDAGVTETIQQLRESLSKDKNEWRHVRVHPRCRHLRSEMASYAYDSQKTDTVVKAFDHGPDALRYLVWVLRGMGK